MVSEYESAGVNALLVIFLTYAPSQIALPALQRTRLPIVVWNTQELSAVNGNFDWEKMLHNHGVHGTQDLANVLLRSGVPFHYVTSHLSDAHGLDELFDYFQAAAAAARLRSCRIGLMGYPFPGMGDLGFCSTHLAATLGCAWTPLSVEQYNQRAAAAPAGVVEEVKADYRRCYAAADDISEADLDEAARAEASLRSMVAEQGLDAMSFQFLALGENADTVTLPFVAVSRLMADGLGFAGEGDIIGAAGTWLLNCLCPPASFSEVFAVDFEGNSLLLSHMGEANTAMARKDRKPPLVAQPQALGRTRGRQLAIVVSFEPGPATLLRWLLGRKIAGG